MLGKRSQPLIGKFSDLLVSGGRTATLFDAMVSPRSPFDMSLKIMMQSPKGPKSYDLGGVGLGIVVALNKHNEPGHEVVPKHAVCTTSNLNPTGPIPVQRGFPVGSSSEDYTYVKYHLHNKTITKVSYDGGEGGILTSGYYNINHKKNNNNNNNNNNVVVGVRRITPTETSVEDEEPSYSYPTSDFLSSCHLCQKNLHCKDIFMYRGEKAFCSSECRSRQIMMDEHKERCRSEASRSVELSSSPYTKDQMFSTGIVAL